MQLSETWKDAGAGLDARLEAAIFEAAADTTPVLDSHVFHSLLRTQVYPVWGPDVERAIERSDTYRQWLWLRKRGEARRPTPPIDELSANVGMHLVMRRAVELRSDSGVVAPDDFLRAVASVAFESPEPLDGSTVGRRGNGIGRPHTVDFLCQLLDGERHLHLNDAPRTLEIVRSFANIRDDDDFGLLLTMAGGRLVLRPATLLGVSIEEEHRKSAGRAVVLNDVKSMLGAYTSDEVLELEELLNADRASEEDFQRFFEAHPHFLQRGQYPEVRPHVVLSGETGPLIPDFVLLDRELQRAAILELKLPQKIVRRQQNRDRFAATVMEARTQLLRYRDWFDDTGRRREMALDLGMEVYRPRLAMLIGRSADFRDEFDRQRLAADNPDVEIITYDDLIAYAKRRLLITGEL